MYAVPHNKNPTGFYIYKHIDNTLFTPKVVKHTPITTEKSNVNMLMIILLLTYLSKQQHHRITYILV